MLLVITFPRSRCQHKGPRGRELPRGARRLAPGSASAHHAFMNQKIMPMSPTRWLVNGVGSPARKYQSFPTWVRMPGVSVTLVWLTVAKGGVHHRREVAGEVAEQRHVMIRQCVTDGELADQVVPTADHRDPETEPASDHPTGPRSCSRSRRPGSGWLCSPQGAGCRSGSPPRARP